MTVRNITIEKSANLQIDIAVANTNGGVIDLTLYSANTCYKKHVGSANVGTITTTGYANGILRLELTGIETANIDVGRYVYETYVTHTSSNNTSRVQEGIITVNGGVC